MDKCCMLPYLGMIASLVGISSRGRQKDSINRLVGAGTEWRAEALRRRMQGTGGGCGGAVGKSVQLRRDGMMTSGA
ncbi:hypothetical protein CQ007_09800 [Pseudomonas sp. MYb185]|nr:hypothetical protein CQ007_09800 [Pseudomonas sp. MYb185]